LPFCNCKLAYIKLSSVSR